MVTKTENRATLPEVLHPEQRLNCAQVCTLRGSGKTSLYADVKAGLFPAPERRGTRFSRWRAGDVLAALQREREATA